MFPFHYLGFYLDMDTWPKSCYTVQFLNLSMNSLSCCAVFYCGETTSSFWGHSIVWEQNYLIKCRVWKWSLWHWAMNQACLRIVLLLGPFSYINSLFGLSQYGLSPKSSNFFSYLLSCLKSPQGLDFWLLLLLFFSSLKNDC